MKYVIESNELKVTVDSFGAALYAIDTLDGEPFMYDGNPKYWPARDLNIFPYVARLYDESYIYDGKTYRMGIHGFAWQSEFTAGDAEKDSISFHLTSDRKTLTQYPFKFDFQVSYHLTGNRLTVNYRVDNKDTKEMIFGLGGHPAFRVPLDDNLRFEDYYLEFDRESDPMRIGMSDDCYVTGKDAPFMLSGRRRILLSHNLFDEDAVILKNMPRSVALKSDRSKKQITVEYPGMGILGIWHIPKTDAPYICIEPWTSISGRDGVTEVLECQSDLVRVGAGKSYENEWYITAERGNK